LSWLALATACGAAPTAPVAPAPSSPAAEPPSAAPAPAAPATEAPTAEAAPAEAPAAAPPEAAKPSEDGPTLGSQKAIDVITARDAAFLVDYGASAHKPATEARCDKESKDDAEKRAACVTKARDQFLPDVLRFRKDPSGQVSLLVYKRNGSQLTEVSVGVVELSEAGPNGVKLKFKGQKGTRPIWRGRTEALIQVPNSYTVEFDEPDLGHLRYDAKVGLVSN